MNTSSTGRTSGELTEFTFTYRLPLFDSAAPLKLRTNLPHHSLHDWFNQRGRLRAGAVYEPLAALDWTGRRTASSPIWGSHYKTCSRVAIRLLPNARLASGCGAGKGRLDSRRLCNLFRSLRRGNHQHLRAKNGSFAYHIRVNPAGVQTWTALRDTWTFHIHSASADGCATPCSLSGAALTGLPVTGRPRCHTPGGFRDLVGSWMTS